MTIAAGVALAAMAFSDVPFMAEAGPAKTKSLFDQVFPYAASHDAQDR